MEVSSQNGSVAGSSSSRAEKFEDEKRRIIDSCFGKKDEDGSLLESYITHIRIIEDASYPSSPPPPTADPQQKKPRLIIVAVRKSGRVRMHKARENANGTFSIGKTWMLDDLSAVQSYSGGSPGSSVEEQQQKQWAGSIGFTVTIGKPYYWQANTQKEKQFFIASLVKIYTKYTGGKSPELIGFDARERDQLTGASPAQRPPPPALQAGPPQGQNAPYGSQVRPTRREPSREPPILRNQPSREVVQRPPGQIQPSGTSFTSQTSQPQFRNKVTESPNGSIASGNGSIPNQPAFRKRLMGSNPSQESFTGSDDGSNLPPRSRNGMNGTPSGPGRFQDRSVTPNSQRAATPDSAMSGTRDNANDVPPVPAPLTIPPERRRPPMPIIGDTRQRGSNSIDNIVPAPLSSPAMRREDLRPPTRSSDRSSPRGREADNTQPDANMSSKNDVPRNMSIETVQQQEPQSVAVETPEPVPVSPVESPAVQMPEEPEEEVRPGLGPMIKKKSKADIGSFQRAVKAATAFNSFKPRAGGAAERLREAAQAKSSEGPDGITGVVPAPSLLRAMSGDSGKLSTAAPIPEKTSPLITSSESIPEVKISVPTSRQELIATPTHDGSQEISPQGEGNLSDKTKPREVKRTKTAAERCAAELQSLGIDPLIIGDRGGELVDAWEQFGWTPGDGGGMRTKNIDHMKEEIERELNKVQAGGWLARLEQEDDRIKAVHDGLDKCIEECEELDALLTLYSVELGTLNEDIAYIEAQSQGLQIQAANQKLLQAELQTLLGTISISSEQLDYLREASLEDPTSIEQIENSLVMLFKAMLTIDPSLGISVSRPSNDGGSLSSGRPGGFGNSELGSMRVLQEKKDVYKSEISMFLRRLKPFLQIKFGAAVVETRQALEREKGSQLTRAAGKAKLDPRHHDIGRNLLWKYSPLMLFSREVDRLEWEELLKMYEEALRDLYKDEFREALFSWKRIVRKPTGDEADLLFTSQQEKQAEGIVTTTRKLTVKRSQTLAKSLRSPLGDNSSKTTIDRADGRLQPYELFGGYLDELVPIISMEQNFIVEFFHISSLEQHDFAEAVSAAPPEARRGVDLRRPRVMDPNRDLAKLVVQSMEEVYEFFLSDMQNLIDWTLQSDPLQGVGVIAAVERKLAMLEESSQEFLTRSLQKLHQRLLGLFNKFLDEQIRAIEETKVKINKRKGVIAFIRIFPSFSLALESMLTTSHDLEIRETVNHAYARINKTMFESLKVIARENPSVHIASAGADPEDKEALNYQILLIENMNHYLEEVDARANPVLEDWKQNAAQEMDEHMTLYLGAVIRRPLGKLLDFLESTESLMLSRQPGESSLRISSMPSHSKPTFKKVLASYDSREIRKGIEQLKKRVEKHFGDADDPNLSRGLVSKVLQNCEKFYEKVEDRILTISRDVYDGDVIAEWTRADVSSAFRK